MLRRIRICLAVLFFVGITALFLDFSGVLHGWLGWMARMQFVPALLSLNAVVIIMLLLLTVLFGRVYCSVLCPLGVMQDVISHLAGMRKGRRFRFSFGKDRAILRNAVLLFFMVALFSGFSWFAALVEPYSMYGRMVNSLFAPLYMWANNLLAYISERLDSYAFYSVDVWVRSGATLAVSAATFLLVSLLAWRSGRTWCNSVCPVGTFLGHISRFSLFRPFIDTAKCNGCKLCERGCKASCIDAVSHRVDYSRCVACMNCVERCKRGALKYRFVGLGRNSGPIDGNDKGRRGFLSVMGVMAVSSAMAQKSKKVDGGLAVIEDKRVPMRAVPVIPAGAGSLNEFRRHCTSCQLCVSKCPNHVLRPSQRLECFMQPEMSFERGFCRTACNICSHVCSNGAINHVGKDEKSAVKIGTAVWIPDNCIARRDGVECGNCERHCPNGAITMIARNDKPDAPKIPMVDAERCLGCGACEYVCPSRPFSAIFVEGIEEHRMV